MNARLYFSMKLHLSLTLLLALGCSDAGLGGGLDVQLTPEEEAAAVAAAEAEAAEKAEQEANKPKRELDENGVAKDATEFTADSPERGRKSKEAGGYLGAVGHARFQAEHKIFLIQVKRQMDTFNALYDRWPTDHDEFMKEIIKPIGMKIPELPEGQEAIYDPADHQLKVQATE